MPATTRFFTNTLNDFVIPYFILIIFTSVLAAMATAAAYNLGLTFMQQGITLLSKVDATQPVMVRVATALTFVGKLLSWTSFTSYLVYRYALEQMVVLVLLSTVIEYLCSLCSGFSAHTGSLRLDPRHRGKNINNETSYYIALLKLGVKLCMWVGTPLVFSPFYQLEERQKRYSFIDQRKLRETLLKLGIISPRPTPLPVELWTKIIELAIEVPEYFESGCAPEQLPFFLHYHRFQQPRRNKKDPYTQSERLRRQLRLVSRTWRTVADHYTNRRVTGSLMQLEVIKGQRLASTLRVDIGGGSDYSHGLHLSSHISSTADLPKLTVLTIHHNSNHSLSAETLATQAFKLLGDAPVHSTRSLAVDAPDSHVSPRFLLHLSTTFDNLRVLILEAGKIAGAVEFPTLHTLDLLSPQINLSGWRCPNLKHFATCSRHLHIEPQAIDALSDFVPLHFDKLEGLVIKGILVCLDSEFWSKYPEIRFLGCYDLKLTARPPSNHPLQHILLSNPSIFHSSPNELSMILDSFKDARTLYISQYTVEYKAKLWAEWYRLHSRCRRKGILWKPADPRVGPVASWSIQPPEGVFALEELGIAIELYTCFGAMLALHTLAYSVCGSTIPLFSYSYEAIVYATAFMIVIFPVQASTFESTLQPLSQT